MAFTFGSLFSGVGGMDLGLERAGMECRWQVENDSYCNRVLAKHWPNVRRYGDIRTVDPGELERVDLICGGFPCQDISVSGYAAGIEGERSGLWSEYYRIICALRPRLVLIENVAALLVRGLARVLSDLARFGYDAEWSVVSACSMGAPHVRRRLFIVAYPDSFDGRPGVRNLRPGIMRPLQAICDVESARADWQARLANPSELYGGANGLPFGLERNRGIGNSVAPAVGQWLGEQILSSEGIA